MNEQMPINLDQECILSLDFTSQVTPINDAFKRVFASCVPLFLLIIIPSLTVAGDIYKCNSADGAVTFTDTPCATGNEEEQIVTVDEFDPNLQNHKDGESYRQILALPDPPDPQKTRSNRSELAEPNYIDIPSMPSRPSAPPPVTRLSPTTAIDVTTGRPMTLTSPNSAIDPVTGKNVSIINLGPSANSQVNPNNHEYVRSKREYAEKIQQRNIAIEAEKQRAKNQQTNANPLLCAEYRVKIESLEEEINSRPDNRASSEVRRKHYHRQQDNKEELSEIRRFVRSYCR